MVEQQSWQHIQDAKEIMDAIKKLKALQRQQQAPDRHGMISALSDAKQTAPLAITVLELMQGDTKLMPWDNFSDADLYRKLTQYQQGLKNYCVEKIGAKMFDELMKE